jgi:hypothetical protein
MNNKLLKYLEKILYFFDDIIINIPFSKKEKEYINNISENLSELLRNKSDDKQLNLFDFDKM